KIFFPSCPSRFQCRVKELFRSKLPLLQGALLFKAGANIRRVFNYTQTFNAVFFKKTKPKKALRS
ncbi:hypothetical protein, partial [Robertkochia flava]|uniref:hypothetical protein n=1 Tax=Robertkochia flava TaxID=3447986 RepID=UPI001CCCF12A